MLLLTGGARRRVLAILLVGLGLGSACTSEPASMPEVLAEKHEWLAEARGAPAFTNGRARALREMDKPPPTTLRDIVRGSSRLLQGGLTQEAIDMLSLGDSTAWEPAQISRLGVAYLRLGEQANCLAAGHAAEVCILPFRAAAVHADPEPARRAAALFETLLDRDSTDLDARWLLNIAHQALGDYPDGVPSRYLIPGLGVPPEGAGDGFPRLENVAPDRGVATMALSGGAALDDFDGDGDLDLIATSWGLADPIRYYENDGRGHFTERTHEAGLDGLTGGLNLIHGDVDNDGDLDVFVLRGAWTRQWGEIPNSLLRNDGQGHFTDDTFAAGLGSERPTGAAAFADVDGDGWLDLFVGNEVGERRTHYASELYLNNRDGTFRDAAREAGLTVDAFVKGAVWTDADADGRPDLYVSIMSAANRLYLNRSTDGRVRFEAAPGAEGPEASFSAVSFDWDQDGRDDLMALAYPSRGFSEGDGLAGSAAREALGMSPRHEPTHLFRNMGGSFGDVTEAAGLSRFAAPVMGVNVEDFDGDGWVDLYAATGAPNFAALVPNRLLMGGPDGHFVDRTYVSGTGHLQKGHGVSFGDVDGDLDPDLYVVAGGAFESDTAANLLFDNPWQDRGWVVFRLEGRQANRSAIGARVAVRVLDPDGSRRTLWRTVGMGGSFGSNSLQLEVGLGGGTVEAVEVTWPGSGTQSTFDDVERGGRYRLVEGMPTAQPITLTLDTTPERPTVGGHEGHGA